MKQRDVCIVTLLSALGHKEYRQLICVVIVAGIACWSPGYIYLVFEHAGIDLERVIMERKGIIDKKEV